VADQPSSPDDRQPVSYDIDTRVTRPARLHNYLAGGDGNFAVDREAAEKLAATLDGGIDTMRAAVRSLADLTERVVRYLVFEAEVDQLLYVGTPVPAGREVHEMAQAVTPSARVVYVGSDPVVLAHAHTLKRGTPKGSTAYVQGSLYEPAAIWAAAGRTLDLERPVAVLVPLTLCLVPDDAGPDRIVAELLDPVPAGSHLMLAHPTMDIPTDGIDEATKHLTEALDESYGLRSRADIGRLVAGFDLVEPGLVQIDEWRPTPDAAAPPVTLPLYTALARKP
jgi:hypothetical protein